MQVLSERKIIKELHLDEVSFVDKPAQEPALAAIMKAEGVSVGDMVSWNSSGGMARGKVERVVREGSINVPDSDFTISAEDDNPAALIRIYRDGKPTDTLVGHKVSTLRKSLEDTEIEKAILETIEEVQASKSAGDHLSVEEKSMTDKTEKVAELETKLADLQKSLEAAEAARAEAEVIAKMSDAEKAYMDGMSDDEKTKFRKMTAEDRAKAMKVAKAADESVTVEGETIYKSAVGADTFAVYKRLEKIEKQAAADREAAELSRLEKRAGDEFANVGPANEVAALLKAAAGMSQEVRERFEATLKAANEAFETLGKARGTSHAGNPGESKLEKRAAEIRKSQPELTAEQAFVKALDENKDAYGQEG